MIIVIGLVHLKDQQDIHVAQEDQYIWRVIDLSGVTDDVHNEDDTTDCWSAYHNLYEGVSN